MEMSDSRRTTKALTIGAITGVAIAILLSGAWHIVNATGSITGRSYEICARLTFYVWPSSILLMEVDSHGPVTVTDLISYVIAIVINGILYGLVARVLLGISRSAIERIDGGVN